MNVCACVNSRKGTCGGGILICQVGLIKSTEGKGGDGGDLPWPVWDMKETKKKKIPDEFPVRLVLPASCRTYQLSYQLGQAFAGKLVTVVDAQKGLILVLLGGIIKPHVEGMLAVYAVSLEMLGWKCKGENQMRVTAKWGVRCLNFPWLMSDLWRVHSPENALKVWFGSVQLALAGGGYFTADALFDTTAQHNDSC